MSELETILDGRRIVICAGAGGVGKTTTAATIGVGLAARGRRVAVVTIDPARRLAASLGLDELGNEPQRVDPAKFATHGLHLTGELWAMMLDPKATLDDLITELAPDADVRAEILANRIYRELSSAVAGTQEYTAIAKLYALHRSGRFDVIVLDTPPSRNALDFLEAPDRLTGLLDGRGLRALLAGTGGIAARAVGRGTGVVLGVLGRVTGTDLLRDIGAFFTSLASVLDGFRARAREIKALLADPQTTFVLVSSPQREPVQEAIYFAARLRDAGLSLGGLIVNGVHEAPGEIAATALADALGPILAARVQRTCAEASMLAERDRESVERLALELRCDTPIVVPHLAVDVHDAAGLAAIHAHLFD